LISPKKSCIFVLLTESLTSHPPSDEWVLRSSYKFVKALPWIMTHLGEIATGVGMISGLILAVFSISFAIKYFFIWFRETTLFKTELPTFLLPLGNFLVKSGRMVGGFFVFLWSGLLMFKADNCPPINWDEED